MNSKNKNRGVEVVGKIISFFLFCNLFTIVPQIAKLLWPYIIDWVSCIGNTKVWLFAVVLTGANVSSMVANNIFLCYVYKAKKPFFEQFRVSPNVYYFTHRNYGHGSKMQKNGPTYCLQQS
jgi:hypothetical protein